MSKSIAKRLADRKRKIRKRLARTNRTKYQKSSADAPPELAEGGLKYELSEKTQAIGVGGVPLMISLAQKLGLTDAIDRRLHLLKFHLPYHESDHVMNFAINAFCGGFWRDDVMPFWLFWPC